MGGLGVSAIKATTAHTLSLIEFGHEQNKGLLMVRPKMTSYNFGQFDPSPPSSRFLLSQIS